MKKPFLFTLSLCGSFLLGACGGGAIPLPQLTQLTQSTVGLTQSAKTIDTGQSVSLTATVSNDPNHGGVSWTVTCPSGVKACGGMRTASSASGVADIYNAPSSVSAPETLTVTARSASDSSKSASAKVTVSPALALVNPPPAQPPAGNVGQLFSVDLTQYVQGGTSPFTWGIKSGTLPAGLTLDAATGVVSGTPTAPTTSALQGRSQPHLTSAGTAVNIVFQNTDSGTPAISVNVSILLTIGPPLPPPPLGIVSPSTMPNGLVGATYGGNSFCYHGYCVYGLPLHAAGGVPRYVWSWAAAPSSVLPPGLSIVQCNRACGSRDGGPPDYPALVSGVPTAAGTYKVILTVTDSESPAPMQTSLPYSITIVAPSPSPTPT